MTLELAAAKEIVAGATCHPSLLKFPDDIDNLVKSGTPLYFAHPPEDGQFPPDAHKHADAVLTDKNLYRQDTFPGTVHGFAVRVRYRNERAADQQGDVSVPEVKKAKEEAFQACVEWLASKL